MKPFFLSALVASIFPTSKTFRGDMLMQSNTRDEKPLTPILTSFDAQAILDAVNHLNVELSRQMQDVNLRFGMLSKTDAEVKGQLQKLREDMVLNRVSRLELEIDDGEREISLLEERAAKLKQQIEVKKKAQDGAVDTEEKIRLALEAEARLRREKSAGFWLGVRESVIKGVLTSLTIAVVMSVFGLIWWLILLRAGAVSIP